MEKMVKPLNNSPFMPLAAPPPPPPPPPCPNMGIWVLAHRHISVIFSLIWMKIHIRVQETTSYK